MKLITKRGFTLIELLVVIAIIGILSSVVLASLNSARAKGSNAAVKSNLQGIRSQAEIVYDDNSQNYSSVCGDTKVVAAINAAVKAGTDETAPGVPATAAERCYSSGTAWAANVKLKTPENGGADVYWCVDSTGKAKGEADYLATDTTVCS